LIPRRPRVVGDARHGVFTLARRQGSATCSQKAIFRPCAVERNHTPAMAAVNARQSYMLQLDPGFRMQARFASACGALMELRFGLIFKPLLCKPRTAMSTP